MERCEGGSVVVQWLSGVQLFATPWTAACQASLSCIISWSPLKLKSIELVMPSNHLIPCHRLLLLHYGVVLLAELSWPAKVLYIFAKHKQHRRVLLTVCFFSGIKFNQRLPSHTWPSASLGVWYRAPFFLTSQSPWEISAPNPQPLAPLLVEARWVGGARKRWPSVPISVLLFISVFAQLFSSVWRMR